MGEIKGQIGKIEDLAGRRRDNEKKKKRVNKVGYACQLLLAQIFERQE
jgi:hypothetical protein